MIQLLFDNPMLIAGIFIVGLMAVQLIAWVRFEYVSSHESSKSFQSNRQRFTEELQQVINAHKAKNPPAKSLAEPWKGFRKFRVSRLVQEEGDATSIYLSPQDGRPLPSFFPGQYLTFSLRVGNDKKPTVRCYSLSDAPNADFFRCTVKRCLPPRDQELPPGKISSYFNDELKEGDLLDIKAPNGAFYLNLENDSPVILLAGGIGITPMLSMLKTLAANGDQRRVLLLYGVQNRACHTFREELKRVIESQPNFHMITCYSDPNAGDQHGVDYDIEGRITIDLLTKLVGNPASCHYFLCGPGPFMQSLVTGLDELKIPENQINFEAFGPASVKRGKDVGGETVDDAENQQKKMVMFSKSSVTASWDSSVTTLMELAEANSVPIDSGCRAGGCGSCAVRVLKGEVEYIKEPGAEIEEGECLTCIGRPKTESVELDI